MSQDFESLFGNASPEDPWVRAAANLFLREKAFHVLQRLQAEGLDQADELRSRLLSLDPEELPWDSDMIAVAKSYEDDQAGTNDKSAKGKFRELSALAYAVSGLTSAQASCELWGSDSPRGISDCTIARSLITQSAPDMPETARRIFSRLFEQVRAENERPS